MGLSETFWQISKDWPSYVADCKSKDKPNKFDLKTDHAFYDLFATQLKSKFEALVDLKKYKVECSLGQRNFPLAGIPWLAVMDLDETKTTQEGYFIVYLFSQNVNKVFLSLDLGVKHFTDLYGDRESTIGKIATARNKYAQHAGGYAPDVQFSDIALLDKNTSDSFRPFSPKMKRHALQYEAGCFFTKGYDLQTPILEDELVSDFNKYMDTYRKIVGDPLSGHLIDSLVETVHDDVDVKAAPDLNYEIPVFTQPNPKQKRKVRKTAGNKVSSGGARRYSKESKVVGEAGESHVYDYECNKLRNKGRPDLAEKIVKQCEDKTSYPGYDFQSFDEHGKKIFIEVKSTRNKKSSGFLISANEWKAAENLGDKFYIYIVCNALVNPRIQQLIQNPFDHAQRNVVDCSPYTYEINSLPVELPSKN